MSEQCRALDGNGRQCRAKAIGEYSYHGDNEIYAYSPPDNNMTWVLVPLCFRHAHQGETHIQAMKRMRKERKAAIKSTLGDKNDNTSNCK